MTAANKIKHVLVDKNLKVADLARLLDTSYANIAQKLKRDNFSEKELAEIADVLGCDFDPVLIDRETGKSY